MIGKRLPHDWRLWQGRYRELAKIPRAVIETSVCL